MAEGSVVDSPHQAPAGPFLDVALPQLPPPPRPPISALQVAQGVAPPAPVAGQAPPPPNSLEALLHGAAIPALPGIDQLVAPLRALLGSFGTGKFGAFNPTWFFKESSMVLDKSMTATSGALNTLDYVWKGLAADDAKASGKAATKGGDQLSDQGNALSDITRAAADTVQRGNAKLAGITQSFAATAVALAPTAFTPPGQAALMTAAAEHFAQAMSVVSQTQGALGAHAAQLAAAGGPIKLPPPPKLDPFTLAQNIVGFIQPIEQGVSTLISDIGSAMEKDAAAKKDEAPPPHAAAPPPGAPPAGTAPPPPTKPPTPPPPT